MMFVDPGVHMCAIAVFTAGGELLSGHYVPTSHACLIVRKAMGLMVEKPRIYPIAQQKGDQNDLIDLAISCGRLQQAYEEYSADTVLFVEPRKWKGTVNKGAMTDRIKALARARAEAKLAIPAGVIASKQHNIWDAVGIGYWHFGYLNRRKIFRGGE